MATWIVIQFQDQRGANTTYINLETVARVMHNDAAKAMVIYTAEGQDYTITLEQLPTTYKAFLDYLSKQPHLA